MDWTARAVVILGPEQVADMVSADEWSDVKTVVQWHGVLSNLLLDHDIHPQARIDYIDEMKSLYEFMHDDQRREARHQAATTIIVSFGLERLVLDRAGDDEHEGLLMLIKHLVLS